MTSLSPKQSKSDAAIAQDLTKKLQKMQVDFEQSSKEMKTLINSSSKSQIGKMTQLTSAVDHQASGLLKAKMESQLSGAIGETTIKSSNQRLPMSPMGVHSQTLDYNLSPVGSNIHFGGVTTMKKSKLDSMMKPSASFLTRIESKALMGRNQSMTLEQAVKVGKLPKIDSANNDTSEVFNFPEIKQRLADKHRGIIRGGSETHREPRKSEAPPNRVPFGMQQLYKDVDSDHQQKMLHSNIYIPDVDTESINKMGATASKQGSMQNYNKTMSIDVPGETGAISDQNSLYQQLMSRYQSQVFNQEGSSLPQITSRKPEVDANLQSHFKKRYMSVASYTHRNINIEMQKHGGPVVSQLAINRKNKKTDLQDFVMFQDQTIDKQNTEKNFNLYLAKKKRSPQASPTSGAGATEAKEVTVESRSLNVTITNQMHHQSSRKNLGSMLKLSPQSSHKTNPFDGAFGSRSHSVVVGRDPGFKRKKSKRRTLKQQAIENSQSRVLKVLSKATFEEAEKAPSMTTTEGQAGFGTGAPKRKKKFEETSHFDRLNLGPPIVDHKKVVLEMDLVDKSKVGEEGDNAHDVSVMKNQDPDALNLNEQIEIVRRQLVMSELGIDIPKDPLTGQVDVKALFQVEINKKEDKMIVDKKQFSPLKSERPDASVIASIEPIFPLKAHIKFKQEMNLENEKGFHTNVKKILEKKEELTDFADLQKTNEQMLLKQGIFRDRLQKVNVLVDQRFAQASTTYLDESVLIKSIKEQVKKEENVSGKPLFPMKESLFINRWLTMKGLTTHQGIPISKTGQVMTEEYNQRNRQMEQLVKIQDLKNLKRRLSKIKENNYRREDLSEDDLDLLEEATSENESDSTIRTFGPTSSRSKSKIPGSNQKQPIARTGLETVNEENRESPRTARQAADLPDFLNNKNLLSKSFKNQSSHKKILSDKKDGSSQNNRIGSGLDLMSLVSATPGIRQQTKLGNSTVKSSSTNLFDKSDNAPILFSSKVKDQLVRKNLEAIERELFFGSSSKQAEKSLKKFGIVLNQSQQALLDKYHNSVQLKSMAGQKLSVKLQEKLVQQLAVIVEKQTNLQRQRERIENERKEYYREQNLIKTKELRQKMAHFLVDKQVENDALTYVLEKEAFDSDEDFNVFDKLAQGIEDKDVKKKVTKDFRDKILQIKKKMTHEEKPEKISYFIDPDPVKLEQQLKQHSDSRPRQKLIFSPDKRTTQDETRKSFNQSIGKHYYDEKHQVNQPKEPNELQMQIQFEIAQMTQKLILISPEHQKAVKKYLKLCNAKMVSPLPILNKLETEKEQKVLSLEDYTVNEGQIECLAQCLDKFGSSAFNKIYINNNRISDTMMETFLEGVYHNKNIDSLEIQFNVIQEMAMPKLIQFFEKGNRNIRVLKLAHTKSTYEQTERLLEALSNYKYLYELKLERFKFSSWAAEYLSSAINHSFELKILDLSWSQFSSSEFAELVHHLENNKTLSDVNFSNISCTSLESEQITESIYRFIRRNKSLLHLDISYMSFSSDELLRIAEACSKCRTLLSIHLSNPVVQNQEMKSKIRRIMRPRKRLKDFQENIDDPNSDDQDVQQAPGESPRPSKVPQQSKKLSVRMSMEAKPMPREIRDDKMIFTRILGHFEMPHSHRWTETTNCWYCQKHTYTLFLFSKSICEKFCDRPEPDERRAYQKKLMTVAQRYEDAFQNNQQDEWGSDNDERYYDADTEERDAAPKVTKKLTKAEQQAAMYGTEGPSKNKDEYFRNVQLAGKFSGWRMKSMVPLYQFIRMLYKNSQNPLRVITLGKDTYEQEIIELRENKINRYQEEIEKRKKKTIKNLKMIKISTKDRADGWVDKINSKDIEYGGKGWLEELLSLMPYKEDTNLFIDESVLNSMDIVNKGIQDTNEKVYAYSCFLPPGKFNSTILYNTDADSQKKKGFYKFAISAQARAHPIEVKFKKVRQFKIQRKFIQDQSIFKDYKVPNFKEMLVKDFKYSKIHKMVKDPDTYQTVFNLFLDNIHLMLDHFFYMTGHSNYPQVSWMDFSAFCQQLHMIDETTLTLNDIDLLYISTTSSKAPEKPQGMNNLCRYEFFEIFVRAAKVKYMERGRASSIDEAVKMLINNHFKSSKVKYEPQGGKSFREEQIWQLNIDDLLKSNIDAINDLSKHFLEQSLNPANNRPYFDLNLGLCQQIGQHLDLTDSQVAEAYAFSKMIHVDELTTYGEYRKMKLVEFADFLVRMAHTRFKNDKGLTFQDKVEKTLDILFDLIGAERQNQAFEIEISSESDYESDE